MRISESQLKAAIDLFELVTGRVGSNRAVHPPTAIACLARLSGSFLLRSFNLVSDGVPLEGLPPGVYLLSPQASEGAPKLINLLDGALYKFGVAIDQAKFEGGNLPRGEEPQLTTVQVLDLLQKDALAIANENGLSLEEAAQAGVVATALMIREFAKEIGAETGFNVAGIGIHDGCRVVPPSLGSVGALEGASKPELGATAAVDTTDARGLDNFQAIDNPDVAEPEVDAKPWYKFW